MKFIPSYTKVLTLGSAYTENALVGKVLLQEKVDGSQFRFGVNEDGELVLGSKSARLDPDGPDNMFKEGVEYIVSIKDKVLRWPKDSYFYAEYLKTNKHNVLKYERIPKNHLVLFDIMTAGHWASRKFLELVAKDFDVDVIPELFKGTATVDTVKGFLDNESFLGVEKIEGVVIKNYNQTILLGGNVFPLFTKYVREQFKERHTTEWSIKKPKDSIDHFIQSFKSEARWQKAFQYLRDTGQLEQQPRDIPKLMERVNQDIAEEETENIKKTLYNIAIQEINRIATRGLPEWYKVKLLENLNTNEEKVTG